jgi:hypothetical protein
VIISGSVTDEQAEELSRESEFRLLRLVRLGVGTALAGSVPRSRR